MMKLFRVCWMVVVGVWLLLGALAQVFAAAVVPVIAPQFNDVVMIVDTRSTDEVIPDHDGMLNDLLPAIYQKCAPIIIAAPILKKYLALKDAGEAKFAIFKERRQKP